MLDTTTKRIALGLSIGLVLMVAWQEGWLSQVQPSPALVEDAAIVHESGITTPFTKEQTKVFVGASSIGVKVIDKDILGPGKQPSPALKPYLDAAKDRELPVLVIRYKGGSVVVESVPATFEALKARVGK